MYTHVLVSRSFDVAQCLYTTLAKHALYNILCCIPGTAVISVLPLSDQVKNTKEIKF